MNKPVKTFTTIALICAVTLAVMHWLTENRIKHNQQVYALAQLAKVLPNANETLTKQPSSALVYASHLNSDPTGFILPLTTRQGYNGAILGWLAVDLNGQVRGIRIVEHNETPGIGDVIETARSDWLNQFIQQQHGSAIFELKRDQGTFDHVSGATITTRAVTRAVGKTLANAQPVLINSTATEKRSDD